MMDLRIKDALEGIFQLVSLKIDDGGWFFADLHCQRFSSLLGGIRWFVFRFLLTQRHFRDERSNLSDDKCHF